MVDRAEVGSVRVLVRFPIEGGGSVLVEGAATAGGPVKAGRMSGAVEEATSTLQAALVSVRDASRAVLEQLREAGPVGIEVQFGVELTAEAGAVIVKTAGGCHLTVTLTWARGNADTG